MTDMVFRITQFEDQYLSKSITRWKMKTPSWFRCPTDSVEVIELINGHPEGLAHLGAWERLQAWAVRNWKTCGHFIIRERPMTIPDIAVHCGLAAHQATVEATIPRVVELGWIEVTSAKRLTNDLETFEERLSACIDKTRSENIRWESSSGFSNITDNDLAGWRKAHPLLDIDHELLKMSDWLKSNPRQYTQWRRFITNWINRARPNGPAPITESGWLKDIGDGND
jgi:hypothetical protein